ncbi:MAG: phosphoribosylglycinamide formyltransferase [Flammeovirgaceae bacterium]|nr:phosphoribosylglycinamide formyltransferase [Flammeovirgaceae bacterium]
MSMCKIALFASGNGSNAEKIVTYLQKKLPVSFVVVSNKKEAGVFARATNLAIPAYHFKKSDFDTGKVLHFLKTQEVDLIVLAGFLLLVPTEILEAYPQRIINIHPALLPKYGGEGMYGMNVHQAVAKAKEQYTGITVHYCNHEYDKGNIILQSAIPLSQEDTPEEIARKVQVLEHQEYPLVVEWLAKKIIREKK